MSRDLTDKKIPSARTIPGVVLSLNNFDKADEWEESEHREELEAGSERIVTRAVEI